MYRHRVSLACFLDTFIRVLKPERKWHIKLYNTRKTPTDRISEINSGDLILKDQFQISNKFSEYFTSIGSTLASKIPQIDGNH